MAYEDDELEKDELDLSPIKDEMDSLEEPKDDEVDFSPILDPEVDKEVQDIEDSEKEFATRETLPEEINRNADELLASLSPEETLLSKLETLKQDKSTPSKIEKYRDYLDQYRDLQRKRSNMDLVSGLAAAGAQIGQAMAGKHSGEFKPDMSGVQVLQQLANRPVSDFEQRQVVQNRGLQLQQSINSADPDSAQSKLIRDYLNQRIPGINLGDDVSANDAMILIKAIGRPSQQKAGQVVRTFNPQTGQVELKVFDPTSMSLKPLGETAGFALQPRQDPRTGETIVVNPATGQKQSNITSPTPLEPDGIDLNRENLTTNQQKHLDDYRNKFLDDTKDDRSAINTAQGIKMTIQSGAEIGGDILRELQNQLARGSGEKGAMTDRDVAPFGGRQDLISRIKRASSMAATGQLPDEDREFLTQVANVMEKRAQQYVNNKADFFIDNFQQDLQSAPNFKGKKINKQSVKKLIGTQSSVHDKQPKMLREKQSGKIVPIKDDKYEEALKSGLFEKVP